MAAAANTRARPALRLATKEGRPVNGRPREVKPLSDLQAYQEAAAAVTAVRARCRRGGEARREFGYLLADLEHFAGQLEGEAC